MPKAGFSFIQIFDRLGRRVLMVFICPELPKGVHIHCHPCKRHRPTSAPKNPHLKIAVLQDGVSTTLSIRNDILGVLQQYQRLS